jgi:hypothetical protein
VDTPIASGTSSTKPLNLTGLTLPSNIIVEVTGSSIGSNGDSIIVDAAAKTSSFDIVIAGRNLQVSEATAKVPSQTIDELGSITLAASENKVQEALISEGTLAITVDNQMAVASKLVLTIASLQDANGDAFIDSVDLPGGTLTPATFPIAGYYMVMDLATQVVEYSYQVRTIDTGDNYVTLNETDQIDVTISLYGTTVSDQIMFSEITGEIESQLVNNDGDIEISSDSKILSATISSGSIDISIDNQINKPDFAGLPTLILTIPEILDGPGGSALIRTKLLEPGINLIPIDLSDHYLTFPDTSIQILTYTTEVSTPTGQLGKYGLTDSIITNIDVGELNFSSVTGYFTQDAMVDSNQIVIDNETKLTKAILETGDLMLTMENRIGVLANVEFQIDEFKRKTDGQSLQMTLPLSAATTPQITTIDLSDYNLEFATANPGEDQAINYVSKVALPADQQMTLSFGDSININVDITNLEMASVAGIIALDTLVIEPDTVSIEMPEEVADLLFEQVTIDIEFNNMFDVPIELTLDLFGRDSLGNDTATPIHIVQDLAANDFVRIDAADLINSKPDFIISSGQALIGGGVLESQIAKGQEMTPVMYINVPLSLIIDDPPFIDIDVTSQDVLFPEDEPYSLDELTLTTTVINQFEFGATVVVLASDDSLTFDSLTIAAGLAKVPDTLLTFELSPKENADLMLDAIPRTTILSSDKFALFEQDIFIKPEIQLLGNTDGTPSRFFTTDSLTLKVWGAASYTIVGDQLTEDGGAE